MNTHDLLKDVLLVGFPQTKRRIKGVYCISGTFESVYVGASNSDVRGRILRHLANMRDGKHTHSELNQLWAQYSNGQTSITITYLSDDPFLEQYFNKILNVPLKPNSKFYHQVYQK